MTQPLLNRHRLRILVVLWVLLASLYTITYSGMIESGDTRRMLDAVGSLVDYGDQYLDLTAWQFPPNQFDLDAGLPLQSVSVEPMQIVSAAPLYWLAKHVPNLGLVHTTYLFNVLVGATIGSVLFLYALTLGYDGRTATLATIVFGIGTAVVPYSKSFFREPLMMLCLLLAAFFLERLRQLKTVPLLICAALALMALALTKASGLLAMPALAVIALPSMISRRTVIVGAVIGLLLAALFVALGEFNLIPGLSDRYNLLRFLNGLPQQQYLVVALHSYLLSPGGSVWGTSPVLLLALPGAFLLLRRGQYRYPLAGLLVVLGFAVGYAVLNGPHWFGGLSWPPRFIVPVLALAFIAAFPALDWLAHHPRSLWIVPAILLVIYAVWVQISGVTLSWGEYPQHLPPEADGFLEWGGGHNVIQYLRWVVIPQLWLFRPLDNAWAVTDAPLIPLLLSVLVLTCALWLWRNVAPLPADNHADSSNKVNDRIKSHSRTSPPPRFARLPTQWRGGWGVRFPLFLLFLYLLITWAGLRILYERDERYDARSESLHAMLSIIETETTADDIVLLSTPGYEPFFLNYRKGGGGRVITLPLQPGEQTSPEQPPEVRSELPDAMLTLQTVPLLHTLAKTHERLWLVVEFGPDLGWSTRPVERFMTMHYYPVEYWQTAPQVRLVEYSTASAPDAFAFRSPEQQTDLVYGESIHLAGFALPEGTEYTSGDALPVSLYWITDTPIEANYSIGVFLRAADGSPVSQSDWQPTGYFAPTSLWQVGVPVWDNRALRIPADLPPGEYQLWVKIYDNPPGGSPQDLTVTGAQTLDDTIGVLPVRITVRNS